MELILYKNKAESNRLDKSDYLEKIYELDGTLRDKCSIISPIIQVQLVELTKICQCNYAYIADFGRYYYIDDVVGEYNSIVTLYMRSDPLMSFKDPILDLDVVIKRNQYIVDPYLYDEKIAANIKPIYEIISGDYNENFDDIVNFNMDTLCIAFCASGNVIDNTQTHPSMSNGGSRVYLITPNQYNKICNKIINDNILTNIGALYQNASEGIISIKIFPLNLDNILPIGSCVNVSKIKIGIRDIDIGENILILSNVNDITYQFSNIKIPPKYNNFLDYNPYTKADIYLPFFGFMPLDINKLMNVECFLQLSINPYTGQGIYVLRRNDDAQYIFLQECNIGFDLPIVHSTLNDTFLSLLSLGVKTASGLVSSNVQSRRNLISEPREYTPKTHKETKAHQKWREQSELDEIETNNNFISNTTIDLLNSFRTHISAGNCSSGWENVLMQTEWVIWIERPSILLYGEFYAKIIGYCCCRKGMIRDFYGYSEISAVHIEFEELKIAPTLYEKNEIDKTLRNGIILPDKPNS